ncbi:pectinesterase [Chitinophaga sp. CF118]|uniref:pectinesterase family protein n=1 Tax=Chitinophaga sp. CF118 TaxID=1884367 RepID=UPI0008E8DF32|nr:pectinesterase family protein [Chitinophaga sp. CF118]SFE16706.1 pectinesterase [Chitinophaga sp. CF118]
MKSWSFLKTFFFALLFIAQSALAEDRKYIVVAKDSSGDFTTIQEAVNAVRDFSYFPVKIFIKKGVYNEKLIIPSWKTGITLQGEDRDSTIITNADYNGKLFPGGKDPAGKDKFGTFNSHTVLIEGDDITAENLTFENTAGNVGQAVALHVEGDRCIIRNCRLLGNQDTLYAGRDGCRQYYYKCYIEGTVDFIFGAATAMFQDCTIYSKRNSYITAASTTKYQQYGFVFINCKLTADETTVNKMYLGRPWRPYSATIFMNCFLDAHILPEGWHNWDKVTNEQTARYAEYKNTGPGAATGKRVAWSRQLTDKEAKIITVTKVFKGWDPSKQNY